MRQILLRAAVLLMSWAIGLLIAAWIVPGVSLSVPGFIVAVVVFSVARAILSLPMLKLPRQYASLLLGGTGCVAPRLVHPRVGIDARASPLTIRHPGWPRRYHCGAHDRAITVARAADPRRVRLDLYNYPPADNGWCAGCPASKFCTSPGCAQ